MVKKNFILPKISKCESFVYFSYMSPETLKFKRFKKHLSRKTPPQEVKKELARMVEYWTNELKNGYNPFHEQKKEAEKTSYYYIGMLTEDICRQRTEFLRLKSRQTYTSKIDIFKEWIKQKGLCKTLAVDFTKEDAEAFLRYLYTERNIGATTRNAYLLTLRTLFKTMNENGILKENVWEKIPKAGETRLGKLPLKPTMKQRLKDYFIEHDPEMWLFVQLEYYCFIRPGECGYKNSPHVLRALPALVNLNVAKVGRVFEICK